MGQSGTGRVAAATLVRKIIIKQPPGMLVSGMPTKKKNPHAVALAKLAVKVRWKGVPKEERIALARKAGKARWAALTKAERSELAGRGGKASRGKPKTKRKEMTDEKNA
jgi:hypothetical protein